MPQKIKLLTSTIVILLIAGTTISAAGGWRAPLAQMNMPTDTAQPESTIDPTATQVQKTPTPAGNNPANSAPSPTWTSIFTGYTPYPDATYSYGMGSGMGGGYGGMMGSGSMGSMMVISGTYTYNGTPMSGMGSMGSMGSMGGSMDMSSCPMISMSGMGTMDMSGSGMGTMDMSGSSMSGGYIMQGMDMSGMSGYVTEDDSPLSNPWTLIGWVLLVLLGLLILAGIVLGIVWIIRRSQRTETV